MYKNLLKKARNIIKRLINRYYYLKLLFFNTYKKRISKLSNNRYRNIFKIIKQEKSHTFLEIGTYDGHNAYKMIKVSQKYFPKNQIEYYGFDLFEAFTANDKEKEFSKEPLTYNYVKQMLEKTGAKIYLYKGYSKETLSRFSNESQIKNKKFDLIFIDGGHSIETITNDWNYVKNFTNDNTIVIFDDYYIADNIKKIEGVGCNSLIHNLDKKLYDISFLTPPDLFKREWGTLKIYMIKVQVK